MTCANSQRWRARRRARETRPRSGARRSATAKTAPSIVAIEPAIDASSACATQYPASAPATPIAALRASIVEGRVERRELELLVEDRDHRGVHEQDRTHDEEGLRAEIPAARDHPVERGERELAQHDRVRVEVDLIG